MPEFTIDQIQALSGLLLIALVAKLVHRETAGLLLAVAAMVLSPVPSTLVGVAVIVLLLRGLDVIHVS